MKKLGGLLVLMVMAIACQKSDMISDFTGNEITYSLQPASQYAVSGTVVFRERKDGQVSATIQLSGTDGDVKYPVHLHLGNVGTTGADVALLMNPVFGKTGKSETTFGKLADETSIDYQRLVSLEACVKIHLGDSGPARDVVLAAGNVGSSVTDGPSGGRIGIAVCKSN